MKALVLFCHPAYQRSRAQRALRTAIESIPEVTLHDLYEEYPDFLIDAKREQQLLLEHDLIIFQHPFYWYSSPALLKEWQDIVLEYGFAYGEKGTALHGKKLWQVISTGGPAESYQTDGYNHFTIGELLRPFEQTALLCGMAYLPPFAIHSTHQQSDEQLQSAGAAYAQALRAHLGLS
jgi:glutathione-regulated potassium-efflux system ancillary protein KefG